MEGTVQHFEIHGFSAGLRRAVEFCNEKNVTQHVFQFIVNGKLTANVIFGFNSYPDYVRWCTKMNRQPIPPEEFFK